MKLTSENISEDEFQIITNEFDVRDALGGSMSGDYEKDKKKVQERYGKTFTEKLYQETLQMQEQP